MREHATFDHKWVQQQQSKTIQQYSGSGSSRDTDQLIISPLTIPSCHRAALPRHSRAPPCTTMPSIPTTSSATLPIFGTVVLVVNLVIRVCMHNDGASSVPPSPCLGCFIRHFLHAAHLNSGQCRNSRRSQKLPPEAIGAFLYGPGHIVIPDIVKRGHRGPCHASAEGGRGGLT